MQEIKPQLLKSGSFPIQIKQKSSSASINFLTLLVKGKAQDNVEPLTTECWTNAGQENVNLMGINPDKLLIYSKAVEGPNPVIDADVHAIGVKSPPQKLWGLLQVQKKTNQQEIS